MANDARHLRREVHPFAIGGSWTPYLDGFSPHEDVELSQNSNPTLHEGYLYNHTLVFQGSPHVREARSIKFGLPNHRFSAPSLALNLNSKLLGQTKIAISSIVSPPCVVSEKSPKKSKI